MRGDESSTTAAVEQAGRGYNRGTTSFLGRSENFTTIVNLPKDSCDNIRSSSSISTWTLCGGDFSAATEPALLSVRHGSIPYGIHSHTAYPPPILPPYLNRSSPHPPLANHHTREIIVKPIKRLVKRRSVATQAQMNNLYMPPKFGMESRYAFLLQVRPLPYICTRS